jgi:hypothetical protein
LSKDSDMHSIELEPGPPFGITTMAEAEVHAYPAL